MEKVYTRTFFVELMATQYKLPLDHWRISKLLFGHVEDRVVRFSQGIYLRPYLFHWQRDHQFVVLSNALWPPRETQSLKTNHNSHQSSNHHSIARAVAAAAAAPMLEMKGAHIRACACKLSTSKIMLINGLSIVLHSLVIASLFVTTSQLQHISHHWPPDLKAIVSPNAQGVNGAHNVSPTILTTTMTFATTLSKSSSSAATHVTKPSLANDNTTVEGVGDGNNSGDTNSRRQRLPSRRRVDPSQSELRLNKSSDSSRLTEQQQQWSLPTLQLQREDSTQFAQTSPPPPPLQPSRQLLLLPPKNEQHKHSQVPIAIYHDGNRETLRINRAQSSSFASENSPQTQHNAEFPTTTASNPSQLLRQAPKRRYNYHHYHHKRHLQNQQKLESVLADAPSPTTLSTSHEATQSGPTVDGGLTSRSSGNFVNLISSAALGTDNSSSAHKESVGSIAVEASAENCSEYTSGVGFAYESKVILCILYTFLTIAAVASNMIVCYIVLSNRRMRTATNYFIVNLAVGDILMASLCIPLFVWSNIITNHWPFGLSLCKMIASATVISIFISAYTMVAISIDKYLAIMYPMRLRMRKTQAKVIILAIWSLALLTSTPAILVSSVSSPDPAINVSTKNTPETNITPASTEKIASPPNDSSLPNKTTVERQSGTSENYYHSASLVAPSNNVSESEGRVSTEAVPTSTPRPKQHCPTLICTENWAGILNEGQFYYSLALMTLEFVLPLFVLVITYSRIVIVVWGKRMPGEEDNARDARMARSKRKVNSPNKTFQFTHTETSQTQTAWNLIHFHQSSLRCTAVKASTSQIVTSPSGRSPSPSLTDPLNPFISCFEFQLWPCPLMVNTVHAPRLTHRASKRVNVSYQLNLSVSWKWQALYP